MIVFPGFSRAYTHPFTQGDIIGVHVDLWSGTLEYYLNRKPLGMRLIINILYEYSRSNYSN